MADDPVVQAAREAYQRQFKANFDAAIAEDDTSTIRMDGSCLEAAIAAARPLIVEECAQAIEALRRPDTYVANTFFVSSAAAVRALAGPRG